MSAAPAAPAAIAPAASAPAPDRRSAPPVSPAAWTAVAASVVAIAWGGNEFTPLLVLYRQVSALSPVVVDGLLAAYVLGIIPALLLGGPLSDLFGRRPLLLPAAPLSFAGSLLLALAPTHPLVMGIGRILCGAALGLVMAVGSTWITELSDAAGQDASAGPRRASLSLTAGFLVGAAVAAGLAQFAPWPTHATYALHLGLTVIAGIWLLRAPETHPDPRPVGDGARALRRIRPATIARLLHVPDAAHRRFLRVVVPVAPWVFGCAGAAYAILPAVLSEHAGRYPIAFSGLMTVVTLGCGVGIQVVGRLIDTRRSARASVIAMGIVAVGVALGALASRTLSLPVGLAAAAVLGVGYGLALVAGLSEVQRIARPASLASLTAVYYSIAYLGFFVPMIFAALAPAIGYANLFAIGTALAVACLMIVTLAWSAHLPGPRR